MDLYDVIIFDNNQRVTDFAQQRTHTTDVARLVLALGDKLGAVSEGDIFICNCAEIRCALGSRSFFNDALLVDAAEGIEHTFENGQEAKAAGINDTSLFQNRVLGHGFLQCGLTALEHGRKDLLNRQLRIGLTQLDCVLCRNSGDSQDRALCGLHNSLVRSVYAFAQRECKITAASFFLFAQFFCHTAEKQGEDNTRVAAGTAQQSRCRLIDCLAQGRLGQAFHFFLCGVHGHIHIGTGIAVGHREDIELIGSFLFFGDRKRTFNNHALKQ